MISCANTAAWLQYTPKSPIHHLAAPTYGVLITKDSVDESYVAVVNKF